MKRTLAKWSLLLMAAISSAAWAQECGSEAQADALSRALNGRSIDGHLFTSPPPLDSVCISPAGDWAALVHWNDASRARAMVFSGPRVIARLGDSVTGRYLAAFTSESRVILNAGRIAFSAWYSDSQASWFSGDAGHFGVFVEDAPGALRLARTLDAAAPYDDWTLTEDARITTRLESFPLFQQAPPDEQEAMRKAAAVLHQAIEQWRREAAQQAPRMPEAADRPELPAVQATPDCTNAAPKSKKRKIHWHVPKALKDAGEKVGVEVGTDSSTDAAATKTQPCPVPAKPGAK